MSLPDAELIARTRWSAITGHRMIRFVLVGSTNTAIDVVVYSLLAWSGLGLVAANLVSTSCGLVVSYLLNRRYVFKADEGTRVLERARQVALFLLTTGIGLWVLQPLVILGVGHLVTASAWPRLVRILVPKLLATAVTLIWNYAFYSLLVFARRTPSAPGPST